MTAIQIGKKGRILQGNQAGWYILIQDDTSDTGGYYVLITSKPDLSGGLGEGYDEWVENKETLLPLFETRGWEIEWENEGD